MRILGIDFGTKRIGLALSDESESIAFPHQVMTNNSLFFEALLKLIQAEGVEEAVVGVSTTTEGIANDIERERKIFVEQLRQYLPVNEIDERFSSHEARLREFGNDHRSARQEKRNMKEHIDADAAQIILQRYLDKKKIGS